MKRRPLKNNKEVRARLQESSVCSWELAEALGFTPEHFSRLMRHELPDEMRVRALKIMDKLEKEHAREVRA